MSREPALNFCWPNNGFVKFHIIKFKCENSFSLSDRSRTIKYSHQEVTQLVEITPNKSDISSYPLHFVLLLKKKIQLKKNQKKGIIFYIIL